MCECIPENYVALDEYIRIHHLTKSVGEVVLVNKKGVTVKMVLFA